MIRLGICLAALVALTGCVNPGPSAVAPDDHQNAFAAPRPAVPAPALDFARPVYVTAALQAGVRPGRESLEGSVWMQADNAEASIRTSGGVVRDEQLNAYVRELVCRLAGPYCGGMRVYIIRVPDLNANVMANGTMQVWTGLLLRSRNEAQLATVLGHEIGHYIQRHSVKRYEDLYTKTNALIFGQMLVAAAGVPAAGDLMAMAAHGSIAAFSRENETEADDIGIRLLVHHGYDPREAAKVWPQFMDELRADKNYTRGSVFLASHPPPEDRSARLAQQAEVAVPTMATIDAGRDRFWTAVGPHRASFIQDELRLRRFDRLEVLLAQLADDGWNRGEALFYQGELYRLRNEKNDNEKALAYYGQAIHQGEFPPTVYRSQGQVLQRLGRTAAAKEAYREYLARVPDAPDRDLITMMIGAGS